MADDYLQFSQVLPRLTGDEEAWLKRQLETVYVFGDREYREDEVPEDLYPEDADWRGCRAYRDVPVYGQHVMNIGLEDSGFQYEFQSDCDPEGWGRYLWVYAEDSGNIDGLACLVQKFLKQFRPSDCWWLTWATTCSKPRVGEFGGGAVFVTADEIRWQSAYEFVEQQCAAFKQNDRPHQEETTHAQTTATKP